MMMTWDSSVFIIFLSLVIDVFKVESMNMTGKVSQQSKKDVNAQIDAAARNQEDSEWGNEDLIVSRASSKGDVL